MSNFRDYSQIEKFIADITTYKKFVGEMVEVVIDLTSSKYFESMSQRKQLIDFAFETADDGHEVFFGPALRSKDLGSKRSDIENIAFVKPCWVDIDSPDKNLPDEEKLKKAKILLDDFVQALKKYNVEPSYIVESGNGYHVYFVLTAFFEPDHPDWEKLQFSLVKLAKGDLQAKNVGRLLRVPGTYNYKDRDNPKQVKIMNDSGKKFALEDFRQLVLDHGPKKSVQNVTGQSTSKQLGFIPPCMASLLDTKNKPPMGNRHQVRQVISTYAFHEGWSIEDTIPKVMHTTDDPKKAERDVRGVYQVLERDPERYSVGCSDGSQLRNLVDASIALCDEGNCQFKNPKVDNEKKEVMSAWFDGLVDVVHGDNGEICFLLNENNTLSIRNRHELSDCVYIPPPANAIPWQVPSSSEVLKYVTGDTDAQLFQDLIEFHKSISELPDENHYKFLAAWDMHTYLMEKFEYYPIIWFYAVPARGKSRTAKGMTYVSWRGVILTTINEAHIIRFATDHKATLFFDIMDLWKKAERGNADDIILHRFERGGKVARILAPDKGPFRDTTYFDIYGPTIIATNKMIHEILETRAIQIVMPETTQIFENDVVELGALPFRERLVAFRARWIDRQLPTVTKPVTGRLGDILKPIRQIVNAVGQDESWFLDFARQVDELRRKDGLDSDDAKVITAIARSIDNVDNGHLLHKFILNVINSGRPDRYHMSPQRLGRITKRLGFQKYNSGEARGIYIDADLLNRLCQRYGIRQDIQRDGILTI
jgi:hypothetical protein